MMGYYVYQLRKASQCIGIVSMIELNKVALLKRRIEAIDINAIYIYIP